MRLLGLLILTTLSIPAFAQKVDKIDLILYSSIKKSENDPHVEKKAKIEMTRSRYDRFLKEDLALMCKNTSDAGLLISFYKKQIQVRLKGARDEINNCFTDRRQAGCQNYKFEDLLSEKNGSYNGIFPLDDNYVDGQIKEFLFGSESYYNSLMEDLKMDEIPYVTIFDPAIHAKDQVPVTNGFYCFVKNMKDELVSP